MFAQKVARHTAKEYGLSSRHADTLPIFSCIERFLIHFPDPWLIGRQRVRRLLLVLSPQIVLDEGCQRSWTTMEKGRGIMPDANGSLFDQQVPFESSREEWLSDIREGNPSNLEVGRRFAYKLITQWKDIDPESDDIVSCDGSGDGGIDVALLQPFGGDSEETESTGRFMVPGSKQDGTAFKVPKHCCPRD